MRSKIRKSHAIVAVALFVLVFGGLLALAHHGGSKDSLTSLYFAKGYLAAQNHHYKEAIEVVQSARAQGIQDFRLSHLLGDVYYNLKMYPEAVAAYETGIRLAQNSTRRGARLDSRVMEKKRECVLEGKTWSEPALLQEIRNEIHQKRLPPGKGE